MGLRRLSLRRPYVGVLVLIGLILIDLALPQAVRLTLLFPLPLCWIAWQDRRGLAWGLAVWATIFHLLLREMSGRPPLTAVHGFNWVLTTVMACIQVELVWRARRYLQQMAEALAKSQTRVRD